MITRLACCPSGKRKQAEIDFAQAELAHVARRAARRETPNNVEACRQAREKLDDERRNLAAHTCP